MQPKVWRLLVAPLALFLLASTALAQGTVDQENDPTPTTAVGCGADPILTKTLGQTFVPDADALVAVALRLRTGPDFTSGDQTTVRVLDAAGNTVVDDVTVAVTGTPDADGYILVLFEFSEVSVTPGDTYLIQWVTPSTAIFTWAATTDNPYADGNIKSCSGGDWPLEDWDCNFITYAPAAEILAAELTCKGRIEDLLAQIDKLGLGHWQAKKLRRPLEVADQMLDAGKPRAALALVGAFMMHARHILCWNVSYADAEALLAQARELARCIVDQHDLERKQQKRFGHWKRHKHWA